MNTEVFDLGKIGITLGGEYDNKVIYEKLTIVLYKGKSYISTKTTQGVSPEEDIRSWQLVAEAKDAYHMLVDAGKITLTEDEFLEQLVDATKGRYIVQGNIINIPDEEDLTNVNVGGTNVLKFKDKVYNPLTYSGMGRKILRKNIVNGVNILTQEMMSADNTKYVIKYDYVLGEDITVPANCVLDFDGGSINNGNIIYNNTVIIGLKKIDNVIEKGVCKCYNNIIRITNNQTQNSIQQCLNAGGVIVFEKGIYNLTANSENDVCLRVHSNSIIFLEEGVSFVIADNAYMHYCIFGFIECVNVKVYGTLEIVGDNSTHLGTEGEYGHGVIFSECENISIQNIIASNCWGDGVRFGPYLQPESEEVPNNISINSIISYNNGRLGVSFVSAEDIFINTISGYGNNRTAPKALIDFEPTVSTNILYNINITNITSHDNDGGAIWFIPSANNTKDILINIGTIISNNDSLNSGESEAAIRFSSNRAEKSLINYGSINIDRIIISNSKKRGLYISRWSKKECRVNINKLHIIDCYSDTAILVMADIGTITSESITDIGNIFIDETNIEFRSNHNGWLTLIGDSTTNIDITFGKLNLSNVSVHNDIRNITESSRIIINEKQSPFYWGIVLADGSIGNNNFTFTVTHVGVGEYNINLSSSGNNIIIATLEKGGNGYTIKTTKASEKSVRIAIYDLQGNLVDNRFSFICFPADRISKDKLTICKNLI